ncbi:MAG: hypothetical protein JRE40_07980 [Deltaproteobacteria bacterium]|nr:hypothetical protein [Deltaproteobacteria bacterium]
MRDMDKERENWIELTDFYIWQLLKILDSGPKHIRDIFKSFSGGTITLEDRVAKLLSYGLITESRLDTFPFRRRLELTERGRRLLELYDRIGEIAKEIRENGG